MLSQFQGLCPDACAMTPEVQWESTELNIYQSEREVEKKKSKRHLGWQPSEQALCQAFPEK